jgi:hypothetical protein
MRKEENFSHLALVKNSLPPRKKKTSPFVLFSHNIHASRDCLYNPLPAIGNHDQEASIHDGMKFEAQAL